MGVPSGVSEKDCHKLYDEVAKGMNVTYTKEDLNMEEEQENNENLLEEFLLETLFLSDEEYNPTFYNTSIPRCGGYKIDPPPHNKQYFEDQIQAVKNYYLNISNNQINFNYHVLDPIYQLEKTMIEYSEISSYDEPDESIARLFADALIAADGDRDDHTLGNILLLLEKRYPYNIKMKTSSGTFNVINTDLIDKDENNNYTKSFRSNEGQSISIFCTNFNII